MTGQSRILLGVTVDVSDETITVTSGNQEVARWSLDEVDVRHLSDGFHIKDVGHEAVLGVTESTRLAALLGVDESPESRRSLVSEAPHRRAMAPVRRDFGRLGAVRHAAGAI